MPQDYFIFFAAILFISFFRYGHGYKPCIKANPVPTDEAWFIEAAFRGFHIVEHSDCNNCDHEDAWSWINPTGRGVANLKKMCWVMTVATHFGTFVLPYNCKYKQVGREECELDLSKTPLSEKLQMGGKIILTHTDNSTYLAGTFCVFGKENLWWIMTTNEDKTLPEGVLEEVQDDFHKMGFKEGNLAVPGKSALYVQKMSAQPENC